MSIKVIHIMKFHKKIKVHESMLGAVNTSCNTLLSMGKEYNFERAKHIRKQDLIACREEKLNVL